MHCCVGTATFRLKAAFFSCNAKPKGVVPTLVKHLSYRFELGANCSLQSRDPSILHLLILEDAGNCLLALIMSQKSLTNLLVSVKRP